MLLFSPTGTSFDSGAISNGFNTIDSGLYDNAMISGQVDTGVKSGQYDVSVKSGQYQTTLQSSQFGGSLASGQFDTGVKSAQYAASLKSGQYDTGGRSGHYDLSYKSAQYGSGVRAGQYDTLDAVLPAFTWSTTTTLPSSSTTVVAGNTSTYTYQASTNNAAGGSSPVSLTLPSSLSGERSVLWALWFLQLAPKTQLLLCPVYGFQNNLAPASGSVLTTSGANVNANVGGTAAAFPDMLFTIFSTAGLFFYRVFVFAGYGVQKNMSYGSGAASAGVSTGQYSAVRPELNR